MEVEAKAMMEAVMEAVLIIVGGAVLIFAADYALNAWGAALWRRWRRWRGHTWDDYKDNG